MKSKKCAKCGIDMECGADETSCWCQSMEIKDSLLKELKDNYADCLCESCLLELGAKKKFSRTLQ